MGCNKASVKLLADFINLEVKLGNFLTDCIDTDHHHLLESFNLSRSQSAVVASRLTLQSKNDDSSKEFQAYFSLVKSSNNGRPSAVMLRLSEHESKVDFRFRDLQSRMKQTQRALKTQRILATLDPLTGLSNRRHFMSLAKQALLMQKRMQVNVGLLMLDIDFFKQINDTHGHEVGDLVLKQISQIIQTNCRETDLICRWGGEEFVVLSSSANADDVITLAERLRSAIEQEVFHHEEIEIRITMSLGLANALPDEECDALVKRADYALYKAKNSGRNKLIINQLEAV